MNLLASRRGRAILFAVLYFAEGAPIGFLWYAAPPLLRERGVPGGDVTALVSALALPWAFKFVWAPFVDAWRGRRFGYRGWIVCAQIVAGLALLPLCFAAPGPAWIALAPLLLLHAFAAATQDVAIDALAIATTPPSERGSLNGVMMAGMLIGRGLVAGGAVYLSTRLGPAALPAFVAGSCIAAAAFAAIFAGPDAGAETERKAARLSVVFRGLFAAIRTRDVAAGVGFAILAGAGFEAVGGTAPLALGDVDFSREEIGTFFALPWIGATTLGALVGGRIVDRFPRRRACAYAVVAVACSVVGAAVVFASGVGGIGAAAALCGVGLCLGALTAASYALFMDLAAGPFAATLCGLLMGATNLCESGATRLAGEVAFRGGKDVPPDYAGAWIAAVLISLLALPALRLIGGGAPPVDRSARPDRC